MRTVIWRRQRARTSVGLQHRSLKAAAVAAEVYERPC